MSDKPQEPSAAANADNSTTSGGAVPPNPNIPAKNRTLILTIATTALLISFAVYTLLKTDFKTYPNGDTLDIADVTKQPEALVFIEDSSDDTDAPLSFEELLAEDTEPSLQPEADRDVQQSYAITHQPNTSQLQEQLAKNEYDLHTLRDRNALLEHDLIQKNLEISTLHEIIDDKVRQLQTAIDQEKPYLAIAEDSADPNDLAKENEDLRRLNSKIESQLSDARLRLKQYQEAVAANDDKVREFDLRIRELTRRQEGIQKEKESLARDKVAAENKFAQSQQKLTAQERSFAELSNALKSHKEALKRMDQSRMEMAAELDATKSQYSKLLHAVATKAKEAPTSPTIRNDIDNLTAMAPETTTPHRAPITSEDGETRYHVVSKGDTLTSISRQYYGTSQRWHEIYESNQAVIPDHNRLKVGLVLVIP